MAKSGSMKERFEASLSRGKPPGNGESVVHEQAVAEPVVPVAEAAGVTVIGVSLPLGELPTHVNQGPLRCDVRLTRHQSTVLRRLAIGLDLQRAKTGDGRRVTEGNWRSALQWLLDQVEA